MPNPGTDIEVVTTPAVNLPPTPQSGRWFVPGATQRGPVDVATVVSSLEAYETVYGGRSGSPYIYDQVRLAFMEKAGDVAIGRAVGSSAAASSVAMTSTDGVGSLSVATGATSVLTVIATGGTFKLTVDGSHHTSALAYNISKADFETALGALSLSPKTFVVTRTATDHGFTYSIAVSGTGAAGTTWALHADTALTDGDALVVSAANPGTWGDDLAFTLDNGSVADTYSATVTLDGETVEAYDNVADLTDLLALPWVYVTLASVTGNAVLPDLDTVDLTGGTDDAPTDTEIVEALDLFTYEMGPGLVSIPGVSGVASVSGSTAGDLLSVHCAANRRIGIVSGTLAEPKATAKSNAASLTSGEPGSYIGYANTWIKVVAGGVLRNIPPDGLIAGLRAVAHREAGPGQPPAGKLWGRSSSGAVRGVVTNCTAAETAELRAAFVTPIREINGDVVVYGWWALTTWQNDYPMLYVRDIVNTIAWEADRIVEEYVFSSIGVRRHLIGVIEGLLNALGRRWADAGALHPRTVQIDNGLGGRTNKVIDPGYVVDMSANSDELLATNTVIADMEVRPVPNASHIRIRIHKAPVRASV